MSRRVGFLLIGMTLGGCAATPSPPVVPDGKYEYAFKVDATGEPLSVKGETFTYTTNERVEVAQREIYDSQGRRVGSDRIYANQHVTRNGYNWYVYQGSKRIDTLSALHIARDKAFLEAFNKRIDKINENRENALPHYEKALKDTAGTRMLGTGLGIAGLGAGAALLIAGILLKPEGQGNVSVGYVYGATGLFLLGGVGFGIRASANRKRANEAAKAQDMANSKLTEYDFRDFTTQAYVSSAAKRYNATLAAPEPAPKPDPKKKPKR